MTIAVTVGPSTTTGTAITLNGCTAGNSLIIGVWYYDASVTISNITITSESNATLVGTINRGLGGQNVCQQFAYLGNITASSSKTITATLSGTPSNPGGIFALEVSGANTSSLLDDFQYVANGTSATNTGDYSGSITTTADHDLIVSFTECVTNLNAPTGSWVDIALPNTNLFVEGQYLLDAGTTGPTTIPWVSANGSSAYILTSAAFKEATAATAIHGRGKAVL